MCVGRGGGDGDYFDARFYLVRALRSTFLNIYLE